MRDGYSGGTKYPELKRNRYRGGGTNSEFLRDGYRGDVPYNSHGAQHETLIKPWGREEGDKVTLPSVEDEVDTLPAKGDDDNVTLPGNVDNENVTVPGEGGDEVDILLAK